MMTRTGDLWKYSRRSPLGVRRRQGVKGKMMMMNASGDQSDIRGFLSRRRLLRASALGGAGLATAAALAACGGRPKSGAATGSTGTSTAKQPKKGGVLVHVGGSSFGSYDSAGTQIDPAINTPNGARGFRLIYQALLGYDPRTYTVQPELAQKWEQVSPTEIVFHLQPGVKWQNKPPMNGREFTADDAVFSLNRVRTNDPRFANRSLLANFDQIQAVDKSTVRITTKGPDATVLSYVSADPSAMLAPEVIQKYDKLGTAEAVVGTGAFIMKSLQENVGAEYVRNPDYWKPGLPYLDGIHTQQFNDQLAAYAAFQGGQLDITLLPGDQTTGYVAKQGSGYTPDWFKDDTVFPMAQPNTKTKPMNDPRVTRALRLLIDHDEFISAWIEPYFGKGRHGSVLCAALEQWDFMPDEYGKFLEWKKPKDDAVKEALSLLNAAGYNKDNPLAFELSGGNTGAFLTAANQLLQAQWARLGQGVVKATIHEYDSAGQNAIRANRSFTYFLGGNGASSPEPDSWFTSIYQTGAARNYTGFGDPTFDTMIEKQRALLDVNQRKALVKDMIKYLIDNGPSTMCAQRNFLNAVKPKVHEYAPEFVLSGRQYEWIWVDA
jgi:peptide/nickel transport system substrate-binding protein